MPAPKRFRLQNRCWILIIINKKYKGDENDCMNMEFYRGLYVSPSLKSREKKLRRRLEKGKFWPDLYLIVLAQGKQNPLEFFSTILLKQHVFEATPLFVVGIADGYAGAVDLVEEIVSDVYRKTQDVKVREFIENNQRQSEEGSV